MWDETRDALIRAIPANDIIFETSVPLRLSSMLPMMLPPEPPGGLLRYINIADMILLVPGTGDTPYLNPLRSDVLAPLRNLKVLTVDVTERVLPGFTAVGRRLSWAAQPAQLRARYCECFRRGCLQVLPRLPTRPVVVLRFAILRNWQDGAINRLGDAGAECVFVTFECRQDEAGAWEVLAMEEFRDETVRICEQTRLHKVPMRKSP